MDEEEFILDESDFEEAILEIAGEIDRVNRLKLSKLIQNEPQVALKPLIAVKKVESFSNSIFQILKTIKEIQIFSNKDLTPQSKPSKFAKKNFLTFTKGADKQYHSITITECPIENDPNQNNHEVSFEDLFENIGPIQSNKEYSLNKAIINSPKESFTKISVSEKIHLSEDIEKRLSFSNDVASITDPQKNVKITEKSILNVKKQIKVDERTIFKNYMKMHKK